MKIQLKRSNVLESGAAKEPTAAQMEYGELAVNYSDADPAIFIKDAADNIIRIGGVGSISDDGQVEIPSTINPPATPEPGNLWYNPEDGRLYVYYDDGNSQQWVDASPDGWNAAEDGASIHVGDTPPATPLEGSLWWNTTDNTLYIYYIDATSEQWVTASPSGSIDVDDFVAVNGDTMTGDLTVPSLNGGQLAGFRNLITNGDFRVFQRGTGVAGSGVGGNREYVGPDRFFKHSNSDTVQQIDTSGDSFDGVIGRFPYAARVSGTQGGIILGQCIEGPLPKGMQVTFSAWVRLTSQPENLYMTTNSRSLVSLNDFSGFYGGTGTGLSYVNPDNWPSIYPGDNVWFKIQRTFTPASPELGLGVAFQIVYPGPLSATVDITGVQVEFGPVATPFEHRPIQTELALCQRYFFKYPGPPNSDYTGTTNIGIGGGQNATTGLFNSMALLPQPLRADPTVTFTGSPELTEQIYNAPVGITTSMSFSKLGLSVTASPAPFSQAGKACNLRLKSGATISFDAEL